MDKKINITYFIGNGFDLALGLKSGYRDFYEYYDSLDIAENKENLIFQEIKNDMNKWSDFEQELGNHIENIQPDIEEIFYKDKYNLEGNLRKYLLLQQNKIEWNNEKVAQGIRSIFDKSIQEFYNYLSRRDKKIILNILQNKSREYKFVNFNYTNTLGNCINLCYTKQHPGFSITHMHGNLDSPILLGVNDSSQIKNPLFHNNVKMRRAMIKPEINNRLGNELNETVKRIISDSGIICVFGMSFGKTDAIWWQEICSWLMANEEAYVIIFAYDNELDMNNTIDRFQAEDDAVEKLLQYCKENIKSDTQDNESIKKRIIVSINSSFLKFDTRLIKASKYVMC